MPLYGRYHFLCLCVRSRKTCWKIRKWLNSSHWGFEINYVKLTLKGLGVNLIPPVVFPSRLEDMKIFSININYFHGFFGFFDISMPQTNDITYNTWRQHFFYLQPNLNRLFNDLLNLYWYWISSSRKIKRGSNWPPPPTRKNSLQKARLIRFKPRDVIFYCQDTNM